MLSNRHTVHAHQSHYGWDNTEVPVLRVAPGDIVSFEIKDSSGGRMNPASTPPSRSAGYQPVNPVTGPVWIDGIEPGDALKVTLLEFAASGWGWTRVAAAGAARRSIPRARVHIWTYDKSVYGTRPPSAISRACRYGRSPARSASRPRRPAVTASCRRVALAATWICATRRGAELYLPVEVAGGLFSIGDTHAAQGDGEVCGTAIESPMLVTARFDIVKDARLAFPRLRVRDRSPGISMPGATTSPPASGPTSCNARATPFPA